MFTIQTLVVHSLLIIWQILVAVNTVGVRYSTAEVPPLVFVAMRHTLAIPILYALALADPASRAFTPNRDEIKKICILGFLGITLNTGCVTVGIHMVGPTTSAILFSSVPIIVMVLSVIAKMEVMTTIKSSGVLVAFVGGCVTLLCGGKTQDITTTPSPKDAAGRQVDDDSNHHWTYIIGCMFVMASQVSFSSFLTFQKPVLAAGMPGPYFLSRA
eukprot:PhM_4_TR13961/c0_g1_i4/m.91818